MCGIFASFGCVGTDRLAVERSLGSSSYGYAVIDGNVEHGLTARAGSKLQMFELRNGDCGSDASSTWNDCDEDRARAEVRTTREWKFGEDFWIGYSINIPRGFPSSNVWTTIGQIHQNDLLGLPDDQGGIDRPNHMQLLISRGRMQIAVWSLAGQRAEAEVFDLGPVSHFSGRWVDVQFHLNTANQNGRLEVYVDNRRVIDLASTVTQKPSSYYFKYGIYISGVSQWAGNIPTHHLFYDEVRIGRTREEVLVNEGIPVD